jgi:hypothetical protein
MSDPLYQKRDADYWAKRGDNLMDKKAKSDRLRKLTKELKDGRCPIVEAKAGAYDNKVVVHMKVDPAADLPEDMRLKVLEPTGPIYTSEETSYKIAKMLEKGGTRFREKDKPTGKELYDAIDF